MLKSPYLFAVSVLIAMLQWASAAKAQNLDLGLSFELPPAQTQTTRLEATPSRAEPTRSRPERIEIAAESEPTALLATKPSDNNAELTYKAVPLPPLAVSEPASKGHLVVTARESEPVSPSGETLGLSFSAHDISLEATAERDHQASNFHTATPDTATPDTATPNVSKPNSDIHLLFAETQDLISHAAVGSNIAPEFTEEFETDAHLEQGLLLGEASEELSPVSFGQGLSLNDWIFEHGTQSLVARTVGSAEGTRRADGRRTQAYYGHVDPGNGVWNLGTFSYQHEASSPEEADEKQLQRLKRQSLELEAQAKKHGLTLSLTEKLNGLDLANQAPLAALDRGGYIERLAQAKRLKMEEEEAILWARTHAYIDPDTRQWNAPGLGNNVHSISQDQDRRMAAISEALKAYEPAGFHSTSLDSLERLSLQANEVDMPDTAIGEMSGGAIAQHVLSDLPNAEVSFAFPPAENAMPTIDTAVYSHGNEDSHDDELVAAADHPVTHTVAANPVSVDEPDNQTHSDIGFDIPTTGDLIETATRSGETVAIEPDITSGEQDETKAGETQPNETQPDTISTGVDTTLSESEASETEAIQAEPIQAEPLQAEEAVIATVDVADEEPRADKLTRLQSGILERESRSPSSPETEESTIADEAPQTASSWLSSLWRTEDKTLQSK